MKTISNFTNDKLTIKTKTIDMKEHKYPYQWNTNDSIKMILIDIEIFEDGDYTHYKLVERIQEQLNKIIELNKTILK